jgi:manganese transport protein
VIVALNSLLLLKTISVWIDAAGPGAIWPWFTVIPGVAGIALLLVYVALPDLWMKRGPVPAAAPGPPTIRFEVPHYRRIGVALDFGEKDGKILSHAVALASHHEATLHLFHVVEGVGGMVHGSEAADVEAREDAQRLEGIAHQVAEAGVRVVTALGYGRVPDELVRLAVGEKIDLLVMGGHGHRGLQDLLFGASISEVRHRLSVPVLVV